MAIQAYPDPVAAPVHPADPALPAADEAARIAAANAANAQNLLFAQTERENYIKRYFTKSMPGWLRAKLLEQPENTVDDLCLVARKQLTIQNLCKTDDYAEGAFSEMSQTVTENERNRTASRQLQPKIITIEEIVEVEVGVEEVTFAVITVIEVETITEAIAEVVRTQILHTKISHRIRKAFQQQLSSNLKHKTK